MKKHIGARIDETLYNDIETIANNRNISVYKSIEACLRVGAKYLLNKKLDTHTALQVLVNTYNAEHDNKII